jgi:polysaccharide biosynthesis/export protein
MRVLTISFALSIFLFGCTSALAQSGEKGIKTVRPTEERPELKPHAEDRYKLVPGDIIDISYRYTPEFNQSVTIQPDGYVGLQIVGDVKLGGLNLEEARTRIAQKASVRLKDPEITILLKEFQRPYFVVSGEVGTGGKFEMRESVTALQAVMIAGGFKDSAKTSQVVVFRKLNDEMAEVRTINLKSIKKTSDLENDLTLRSGDIVFVPRNTFSKIERFMRLTNVAGLLGPLGAIFR